MGKSNFPWKHGKLFPFGFGVKKKSFDNIWNKCELSLIFAKNIKDTTVFHAPLLLTELT